MKYQHGQSEAGAQPVEDGHRETEEFTAATTPQLIPEIMDDRNYCLSKGRFLPAPVNWKIAARETPRKQLPVVSRANLGHIGINAVNPKTMKNSHDR